MTDQELLELAAKAVGYELTGDGYARKPIGNGHYENFLWNPLEDDGDAFRLAVRFGFDMMLYGDVKGIFNEGRQFAEMNIDDPYSAVRRAIVRAAAEIGKSMP